MLYMKLMPVSAAFQNWLFFWERRSSVGGWLRQISPVGSSIEWRLLASSTFTYLLTLPLHPLSATGQNTKKSKVGAADICHTAVISNASSSGGCRSQWREVSPVIRRSKSATWPPPSLCFPLSRVERAGLTADIAPEVPTPDQIVPWETIPNQIVPWEAFSVKTVPHHESLYHCQRDHMTPWKAILDQIIRGGDLSSYKRSCGISKEAKINRKGQDTPPSPIVVTFFGTLTLIEGHVEDGSPFWSGIMLLVVWQSGEGSIIMQNQWLSGSNLKVNSICTWSAFTV